jgi:hypothetical protein
MDSTPKHRRGQAAPADLRAPPADEREALAEERDRKADEREAIADRRDRNADQREALADERDRKADQREALADEREKHLDELAQHVGVQAVSQVGQSRQAIERSHTTLSASRDRLARNEATLRRAQASSQSVQAQSDRVARGEDAFPATLRVTMTLMMAIARTERDIAETLQGMAARSAGEKAARRRKLAADAIQGAHDADKHHEQLQQLAEQWSEHASVVTLHQLLARAASVLTELARTEQDIADTFTSLARHDSSPLAAQRRQLAIAAATDAQYARNRARDLHQLARTSAASTRPL